MKRLLALLLAATTLLASAATQSEVIPVETFFKPRNVVSLRLSPTGEYFAAQIEVDGDRKLAVLDAKTYKILSLFQFDNDKDVGRYGWLNDERVYAEMVEKTGPLAQPIFTGFVFAGNADGSKQAQLLPRKSLRGSGERGSLNIVSYLPEDPDHILVILGYSSYPEVKRMNVYTGRTVPVTKGPKYSRVIADFKGQVRAAVGGDPETEMVQIFVRDDNDADWQMIREFDRKTIGMSPLGFTKDSKNIYMNVREDGKRGIYLFDTTSKELSLIHSIEGDADVESMIYDSDFKNPEIIGIERMPGYPVQEFFNPQHPDAQLQVALQEALGGERIRIVNRTKDGNQTLVFAYSDTNPGTYFLFDKAKNNLDYLFDLSPHIDREKMAEMKPVSFKARDGLEIRGYLTLPKGKQKNLPMVMLVHGGPYGVKDDWGFNYEAQFLANRGYAVFQVNYRGSGGRGSSFQYDAFKQVGVEMQNDLTDATLWAVEQGYADKDRLCIYGGSYGGYASLMGVAKEPDLYKCAIGYVGAYDIRAFKHDIYHKRESGRKFAREAWGYGDEEFMTERSPVSHVKNIKADLFIAHGRADKICPMEHYESLTEALDKNKIPYQSMVKDHEGHGYRDLDNRVDFYTAMEKFLAKNIGGKVAK